MQGIVAWRRETSGVRMAILFRQPQAHSLLVVGCPLHLKQPKHTPQHTTSHHITTHHTAQHHTTPPHHITPHHTTPHHTTPRYTTTRHDTARRWGGRTSSMQHRARPRKSIFQQRQRKFATLGALTLKLPSTMSPALHAAPCGWCLLRCGRCRFAFCW